MDGGWVLVALGLVMSVVATNHQSALLAREMAATSVSLARLGRLRVAVGDLARLAVVARHVGSMVRKVRRVAEGFQEEIRDLVEDPSIEALARERGRHLTVPDGAAPDRPTEQDGA